MVMDTLVDGKRHMVMNTLVNGNEQMYLEVCVGACRHVSTAVDGHRDIKRTSGGVKLFAWGNQADLWETRGLLHYVSLHVRVS